MPYSFPNYSTVEQALTKHQVYNGFYNGCSFKIKLTAGGVFMSEIKNENVITRLTLRECMDATYNWIK